MYAHRNFKTKKALKEAVKQRNKYDALPITEQLALTADETPEAITYYQPGPFGGNEPLDGRVFLEGPHYPEPHRWYADCKAAGGFIVGVK